MSILIEHLRKVLADDKAFEAAKKEAQEIIDAAERIKGEQKRSTQPWPTHPNDVKAAPLDFTEVGLDGRKLPHTVDAKAWAKEFLKCVSSNPSIATCEDTMLGWFANAMCAQLDECERRHRAKTEDRSDVKAAVEAAESRGYYQAKDEARNRYFEDGLQSFTKWLNEPRKSAPAAGGGLEDTKRLDWLENDCRVIPLDTSPRGIDPEFDVARISRASIDEAMLTQLRAKAAQEDPPNPTKENK